MYRLLYTLTSEPLYFSHSQTLHSKVLNEDRLLSIKLPEGYESSLNARYPVLYTLDGNTHFRRVAGTVEWLSDTAEKIPQHIVVAIHGDDTQRGRDTDVIIRTGQTVSGAEMFYKFLSMELIPHIEKSYRAVPHKILAGHSGAGRFALYVFGLQESPFDAYIVMSPALHHIWEDLVAFTSGLAAQLKLMISPVVFYL